MSFGEVVVACLFAVFFLWGAITPGSVAAQLILGAMLVFWVGWQALGLARWRRRADQLVEILSSICEAVVQ